MKIEHKKGSIRSGVDKDGKPWRTTLKCDYGYIKRTKGTDGDQIDCYIGPFKNSANVYVVHQNDPETNLYDEDKVMLGFMDEPSAVAFYLAHYNKPGFLGGVTAMTLDEFKDACEEHGFTQRFTWKHKATWSDVTNNFSAFAQDFTWANIAAFDANFDWNETLHPRHPRGSGEGGRFRRRASGPAGPAARREQQSLMRIKRYSPDLGPPRDARGQTKLFPKGDNPPRARGERLPQNVQRQKAREARERERHAREEERRARLERSVREEREINSRHFAGTYGKTPEEILEDLKVNFPEKFKPTIGEVQAYSGKAEIRIDIDDTENGARAGDMSWYIRETNRYGSENVESTDEMHKDCHLDYFELKGAYQASGIAKPVLMNLYNDAKEAGCETMSLLAALTVGAYAWARYGFYPESDEEFGDLQNRIRQRIEGSFEQPGLTAPNMSKVSDEVKARIDYYTYDLAAPKDIWKIADDRTEVECNDGKTRTLGQALLLKMHWKGIFHFSDPQCTARFEKEVTKGWTPKINKLNKTKTPPRQRQRQQRPSR